ncbi:DUF4177 domain-containing protein [Undibacterium griseum]|uniref:DUF4177 domain-containing protein n=1 Tax=Undibacterium griseum TaxID=2762295 RepID=A0ABR6YRN5_9BURK|nr:DUF4177 domain-containing protein [Undibacterium griseum]MBC3886577.1 DUF4177 domain-containing protein [Undibacterium griseum]
MNKWEYKVIAIKLKRHFWTGRSDHKAVEEKCNDMGQQGWELVSVEGLNMINYNSAPILTFKRPI